MALGDVIARLSVELGMNTAAFEKNAKQAGAQVKGLEGTILRASKAGGVLVGAIAGFAGAAVLGGIQSAVAGAFDLASSMSEAAGRIGVTVEALQELRVAANDYGISNESLESSMGRLNVLLGDLANKSPTATKAFAALGLSAQDLKGKSPDQALAVIADRIAAIKDPTLQAAAAQDIFGKSYAQFLPLLKEGSAALREAAEESRRNGQISTQDAKDLDYLADTWEKSKVRIGVATAQIIAAAARMPGEIKQGFLQIGAALSGLVAGFQKQVGQFVALGANIVAGLARGIRNAPQAVWAALKSVISSGITNAKALLGIKSPSRVFMEIGEFIGSGLAIGIEGGTSRVAQATKKLTDAAKQQAEDLRTLIERLYPDMARLMGMRDDLATIDRGESAGLLSRDAANDARYRVRREAWGTGEAEVSDAINTGPLGITTAAQSQITAALRNVGLATDDLANKTRASTVRVAQSFKDMAEKTMQSLRGLADAIKGGGVLDILEGVVGLVLQLGSTGLFGKKFAEGINASVPGYATGTMSAARGLALVGERGPELVNFRGGERVFNARDTRGMMGGKLQVEVVANNNGFGAIIRDEAGHLLAQAAPSIVQSGGAVGYGRVMRRTDRSLVR